MRAKEFTKEAVLDPKGWGETPLGTDVDYFGIKVKMRPSMFLKLAAPLSSDQENPEVKKHMQGGGKIAYPWLEIKEPFEWASGNFSKNAQVVGHEGRNRMKNWIKLKGDEPIQVNIFLRGANRRRYINNDMINALSQGLFVEKSSEFIKGPIFNSVLDEDLTEAEKYTSSSIEIRTMMREAGYKLLGSGYDATVWANKTGPVIKIIMPSDKQGAGKSGDIFMKFYEFCKEHKQYENLPKFSENELEVFEIDDKKYIMVGMEKLSPIPKGSFEEAMIWILSYLVTIKITWEQAIESIKKEQTWMYYDSMDPIKILRIIDSMDEADLLNYEILFKLMTVLYYTGEINKVGWDLHTENAMMRGNTIVITDPWFGAKLIIRRQ